MGKEENTAEEAGPTPELEVSWREEGKEHLHGSFWGRGCPRSYALEQTTEVEDPVKFHEAWQKLCKAE